MSETNNNPCTVALKVLRYEIKTAILNGLAKLEVKPYFGDAAYFASVHVNCGKVFFDMTVGKGLVCVHNDLLFGLFDDNKADRDALVALCEERLTLTAEEIAEINDLRSKIDAIKNGRR